MVSVIPYVVDIIKRRTKPNIVSWVTWTLLTGIAAIATFAAGEPRAGLLLLGSTICSVTVVVLGLRYGTAKLSRFDISCWIAATAGIILWQSLDSPTIAIVVSVVIDLIGVLPTLKHSWLEPAEETWQTFVIGVIGPLLTLISLDSYNLNSALYAGYLLLANGLIALTVVLRRKQKGIGLSRHTVHETLHE
jgi:hypothetical protein